LSAPLTDRTNPRNSEESFAIAYSLILCAGRNQVGVLSGENLDLRENDSVFSIFGANGEGSDRVDLWEI
jgi:hypothetical protein